MSDAIPNLRPEPLRGVPRAARAYQGLNAGIVTRSLAGVTDGLVVISALVALWVGWSGPFSIAAGQLRVSQPQLGSGVGGRHRTDACLPHGVMGYDGPDLR